MAAADIAIDRHAVIEASAGTGKTHTLVELVLRLLTETDARLEEILLVTFTEKATGELKARLREGLERLAGATDAHRDKARAALDAFDRAAVFTIHGFCQRVLQDHAFANRQDFAAELVNDADCQRIVLREIQRTRWRQEFQELLPTILKLAGYDGEAWEEQVLNLAGAYRPACKHRMRPEPMNDLRGALNELEVRVRADYEAIRGLAGISRNGPIEETAWWLAYSSLNFAYRDKWREDGLRPVLKWLLSPLPEKQAFAALFQLLQRCRRVDLFQQYGFPFPVTRIKKEDAKEQIAAQCPELQEGLERLDQLRQQLEDLNLEQALATWTVRELQDRLDTYKRERGLQSFDDLLTRLDAALSPDHPEADVVLSALRDRFRYAVVDEFQDTDPVQWQIFRRIFVEGGGEQRLFVVGDPKQAIFGFRGADLKAYQKAVDELGMQHKAQKIPLAVNWRSDGRLLDALNQLFERGAWFAATDIEYTRVQAAPTTAHPYQLLSDNTGRAALTLLQLLDTERLAEARQRLAWFIAGEIRRLLGGGPDMLRYQAKNRPASLQAGDICVLVAKRPEARSLLEALRECDIPYTFFKEPGLWQADEAKHLAYLLRAIGRPGDLPAYRAALLTRFFRLRPDVLAGAGDVNASCEVGRLFLQWRELAGERRWAALFHSILHETGVLFHEVDAPDAERRRANLTHIIHTLEHEAYQHDLDLLGLLEMLEEKMRDGGRRDDANNQPIETDRSKVKIMTIHASKGLEFPVVFLAGGLTFKDSSKYRTYRDDQGQLVLDLRTEDAEAKEKHLAEREAEDRRLYYVALTRAEFKLYVPWVLKAETVRGWQPGPAVSILGAALTAANLDPDQVPGVGLLGVPKSLPKGPAESAPAPVVPKPAEPGERIQPPKELFPQAPRDLAFRRMRIRSFSSLHRQAMAEGPVYLHRPARAGDETSPGPVEADPFRGPVFGEMLHDILEDIEFDQVGAAPGPEQLPEPCRALIEQSRLRHWPKLPVRTTAGADMPGRCAEQLARLTWNALHTPLPELGPLWRIPRTDRLHELEFHFPAAPGDSLPPGIQREEGFLTGFMDLVVRRAGRFYLLDWKSNTLPAYGPEDVARSVTECDYVRQYRIYLQALTRWLRKKVAGFDPTRHLAGVFYLYVRGLSGQDSQRGVYHHRPQAEDFELGRVLRT